jgi:hypothetical protein
MNDPIAAAVGAYALFAICRTRPPPRLDREPLQLFQRLPDGAAIRAEHLARLGAHDDAVDTFLKLLDRGLPLFTDGLAYALDRLRLYRDTGAYERLDAKRAQRASILFDELIRLAPNVDFGSPVLMIEDDPLERIEPALAPVPASV